MFWETPMVHAVVRSADYTGEKEAYLRNVCLASASPRRRRAASTSFPLKTLGRRPECLNLDSLFHNLPDTPRIFSRHFPPTFYSKITRPTASRAHINSLPTELLCLIFDSYLSPFPDDSEPDMDVYSNGFFSVSREYVRTPTPLTHVCRQWRHAAIRHRKLWNNIAFALTDGNDRLQTFARGKIQLLCLFLARARDTPLSIAFAASTSHGGLVFEALQCICRYSHLWKDLWLELDRVQGAEMFLDQLASISSRGSHFKMLESLHLELVVDDEEVGAEEDEEEALLQSRLVIKDIYGIVFQLSPNLTDITLDDLFFVWAESADYSICPSYQRKCHLEDDSTEFIPWKQLKNISIACESISSRKVLKICSEALSLESLKVWRVGCDGASEVDDFLNEYPFPRSSVVLPRLRSLDITLLTEPDQLFGALSLPALEKIVVDVQSLRGRFSGPLRSTSLQSILAPINRILQVDGVPTRSIDVNCKIHARCVEEVTKGPNVRVLGNAWMEASGLHALAGTVANRSPVDEPGKEMGKRVMVYK